MRTWHAGKPKKKPGFNPEAITQKLLKTTVKLYKEGASLFNIAKELIEQGYKVNPMKVRKLLITAGVYESEVADRVMELHKKGRSVEQIMEETGLSCASVHSYLPYSKIVYKLDEVVGGDISVGAERQRLFKKRRAICEKLREKPGTDMLWEALMLFAGYEFRTAKGLPFTYTIKGGELFVSRKEKSITRSTVEIAYRKAVELGPVATEPKKLGVFGASYLYPIFIRLGVIVPYKIQ